MPLEEDHRKGGARRHALRGVEHALEAGINGSLGGKRKAQDERMEACKGQGKGHGKGQRMVAFFNPNLRQTARVREHGCSY